MLSTGLIILSTIEIIGNGFLFIIIFYEKYGMDPQKRTVNNQLLSALCKILIVCNTVFVPFISFRVSFDIPIGMLLRPGLFDNTRGDQPKLEIFI